MISRILKSILGTPEKSPEMTTIAYGPYQDYTKCRECGHVNCDQFHNGGIPRYGKICPKCGSTLQNSVVGRWSANKRLGHMRPIYTDIRFEARK